MKRILVPLDGSRMAEKALDQAVDLSKAMDGAIILVRVIMPAPQRPSSPLPDPLLETQKREAEGYIAGVIDRLKALGVTVESHVLVGDPAKHIIDLTESDDCDLVIMSSHGLGGGGWHVFGSVAQKVLHAAHVPVMIVRWSAEDQQPAPTAPDGA